MSNPLLEDVLEYLRTLVAFDTRNPPRAIRADGIFGYLREQLDGFEHTIFDLGDGCISLLATRGDPDVLFNFHVDTVPDSGSWTSDPLDLYVGQREAVGLGACDIKGASACMLAAAARTDGDLGLLFTSDEEAGSSRCVNTFLEGADPEVYEGVVVAEPTSAEAITAHRGIATATGTFFGQPGHGSEQRALEDNALHAAVAWADAAVEAARRAESERWGELAGVRLNLGRLEGGVKPNVIAPEATVRFGVRPRPDQSPHAVLHDFFALVEEDTEVVWEPGFIAPSLPADLETNTGDANGWRNGPNAGLAERLGMTLAEPVDFWTEAALFSRAGFPAVVFGPGDIAQAHTADESVPLEDLERVAGRYIDIIAD